jgi:hypothetical protein
MIDRSSRPEGFQILYAKSSNTTEIGMEFGFRVRREWSESCSVDALEERDEHPLIWLRSINHNLMRNEDFPAKGQGHDASEVCAKTMAFRDISLTAWDIQ